MPAGEAAIVDYYRKVERERMRGLPFVNYSLRVEAVGFDALDDHRFGILIAPWFMNMVILPGNDDYSAMARGDSVSVDLPGGRYDFTVCRDDELEDCFLSAVLFRSVSDFPDQATARAVAEEILEKLRTEPAPDAGKQKFSRRSLMTGLDQADA